MAVQTITYDNKVALNENAEIADINKCNASDMNEIKSVVNNNSGILGNSLVYSANETNTGKTWIDGKPIYRKVLEFTTSSSSVTGWTNIAVIDSNMDNIINIYGYTLFGGNKTPIPRYESTEYYLIFLAVGGNLRYRSVGFTSATCELVVEYTKTTD